MYLVAVGDNITPPPAGALNLSSTHKHPVWFTTYDIYYTSLRMSVNKQEYDILELLHTLYTCRTENQCKYIECHYTGFYSDSMTTHPAVWFEILFCSTGGVAD